MDEEKYSASHSGGGHLPPSPTSPTSHSEHSSEEENARLLEDDFPGDSENTTTAPQAVPKKSFLSPENRIALSHFLRIFSYSTRSDRILLIAASTASVLTGVTLPLMNVVFGELVGVFTSIYDPKSGKSEEMFMQIMNRYVLYIIYLFIARLLLGYIATLGFRMASIRISAAIRLSYLQALVKQPISVLDTLPPGQTAVIITITANILQLGISEKLSMLLQSISLVVTALAVAFCYNWVLTLVTGSGLLFIVVFYFFTIPHLVKGLKEVEEADKMGSSFASEVFEMIRMVAACGAETKMAKRYSDYVNESRRRGFLLSPIVAIQQAPAFFAIHATFALSFWYAIKMYLDFEISNVTTIIIILTSIMSIVTSIGGIAGPMTAAAHAAGAAGILYSIIDAPQPYTTGAKGTDVSSEDIVLENINFSYPMRPHVPVLDNLNLRFPAGKITAIVGASGSGKSTIVGLLERWYELDGNLPPEAINMWTNPGTISVGGQNVREIDLTWWRSQIGLVQQEPFLFNTTIAANVEYGLIGTEWEYASTQRKRTLVEKACKEAFAEEFIARLPEGYDTIVGDAGIKLSGGQRQRLAIARSIVKQPHILILDEATSAVDVHSERIIQLALDRISKNRTTITIAHRLSTIMKADNIVVLKKGKVVQQGTHEQLIADKDGHYWGLANAQQLSMSEGTTSHASAVDPEKQDDLESLPETLVEDFQIISCPEEEAEESKLFLGNFALFLWEQNYQWRWYAVMLVAALGAGVSFPIHAFLFAKLISLFNFWGEYLRDQTNFWCLMLFFLAIGVAISYFILGWSSNVVSFQIAATYRKEYFSNVLIKPVSYHDHEDNSVGALTSRMASDPIQLQQLLGLNMAIVLISLFNIMGSIALALYFGWELAILSICTSMPIILFSGYLRLRYEVMFERLNHAVFADSSKFATEAIGAFRTVSSLTLEEEICGRYERLLRNHTDVAFKKARWSTLVFALSDSSALLCMAFILWYGGQLLATREYTPFNYMVIYLAVVQGSSSAGQSLSFGPNVASAFAAANRIRNMRPSSQDEVDPISEHPLLETEKSEGVKVELRNVSFRYPTRDVPVLNDVSMTIEAGQFAAIVGPSGCGKTSIISLLERFYAPQSGQILLQSHPITSIPLSTYRSTLSLVAQEASLFSGTICENILLGIPTPTPSSCSSCIDKEETELREKMKKACIEAGIHDFITSLPEGYNTNVGAKGIALSGGQKQRLSIARALIRRPQLLLLDEATSNLDSETERDVMEVFSCQGKGRGRGVTRIVVAHRLATVQNADVIFVMGEGRVLERGSHGELLAKKGVYWEMCRGQVFGA